MIETQALSCTSNSSQNSGTYIQELVVEGLKNTPRVKAMNQMSREEKKWLSPI